jgi:hypothetical protein
MMRASVDWQMPALYIRISRHDSSKVLQASYA